MHASWIFGFLDADAVAAAMHIVDLDQALKKKTPRDVVDILSGKSCRIARFVTIAPSLSLFRIDVCAVSRGQAFFFLFFRVSDLYQ